MSPRSINVIAFLTILAVCLAGALHVSYWAVVAGACILALLSITNRERAVSLASKGTVGGSAILLASSTMNAAAIASAALIMGRGIGWVWGV